MEDGGFNVEKFPLGIGQHTVKAFHDQTGTSFVSPSKARTVVSEIEEDARIDEIIKNGQSSAIGKGAAEAFLLSKNLIEITGKEPQQMEESSFQRIRRLSNSGLA